MKKRTTGSEAFRAKLVELTGGKHGSKRELADAIGVTPAIVYGWFKGKTQPGLDALVAIARHYSITVDSLLGTPVTDETVSRKAQRKSYGDGIRFASDALADMAERLARISERYYGTGE